MEFAKSTLINYKQLYKTYTRSLSKTIDCIFFQQATNLKVSRCTSELRSFKPAMRRLQQSKICNKKQSLSCRSSKIQASICKSLCFQVYKQAQQLQTCNQKVPKLQIIRQNCNKAIKAVKKTNN